MPEMPRPEDASYVPSLVFQALADEDWERAARTVEEHWPALTSYHIPVIRAVADSLPESFLAANPRWLSIRQYIGNMLLPRHLRPTTYPSPRIGKPELPIDRLTLLVEEALVARSRGDWERAARLTEEGARFIRVNRGLSTGTASKLLPVLEFLLGLTFGFTAREPQAVEMLRIAYADSLREGDPRTAAEASAELAWLHALAGRRSVSREWIDCHIAITSVGPAMRQLRNTLHLALAVAATDRLDFPAAHAELDLVDTDGLAEHSVFVDVQRVLVDAYCERGDVYELLARLDTIGATFPAQTSGTGAPRIMLDYARATVLGFGGQQAAALELLDEAEGAGGSHLLPPRAAAASYALGDFVRAERTADQVIAHARAWPRSLVAGLVIKAACAWRRHDMLEAADAFRQAVAVAVQNEVLLSLAAIPLEDFDALRRFSFIDDEPVELERLLGSPHVFALPVQEGVRLTAAERKVLTEAAHGGTIAEIAERLGLSTNTVKAHTRGIYRKLGVTTRSEMLAAAARLSLI